jgi:broad specificity phosphatase PhoE
MLKTVTLIRHGKPEIFNHYSLTSFVCGAAIQKFIDGYNSCDLASTIVPHYLKHISKTDGFFISSNLKRARDSFQLLGVNTYELSELFVEAELPYGMCTRLKMPLFIWAFMLRIMWYFGYAKNCESIQDFKKRINKALVFINEKLKQNDNVVIMSHGFVNYLLEKELLKDNWIRVESQGRNNFYSYKKYSREY